MLSTNSIAERLKQVKTKEPGQQRKEGEEGWKVGSVSPSVGSDAGRLSPAPESLVPRVPSMTATTPSASPVPSAAPQPAIEAAPGLGVFGLPMSTMVTTKVVGKASGVLPGGPSRKEKKSIGATEKGMLNPKCLRQGGDGKIWEDSSMADWPTNDFRLFVGNLGTEVTTEMLAKHFSKYTSFLKAKVVINSRTLKSKGYGFVSFKMPEDGLRAMREMEGKHIGTRPITLKKSTWQHAQAGDAKEASKQLLQQRTKRNQKYHFGVVDTEAFKPY
eukprot:TRINITY_DN23251_c0_g1_i1.p1 TRINITY_DN23251_c0_g1~~TRINITY_DN23251_c0_g1_i1.p1  ORF type:complete len:273 (+),score=30.27 TRINITY_DN23251_c0_g1_i1:59-877(+)